jgi:hypothetical protein
MIDPKSETLLSLSQAARVCPPIDGKRPHASTVFRWITVGVRGGVRLECLRIGRRLCTTEAALARFFHEAASTPMPVPPHPRIDRKRPPSAAARRRQIEKAEARLAKAGI